MNSTACAALATACLLASVATSAAADDKCHLGAAPLPVTMSGMRAMITLKVNGVDAPFVLDTGSWYSMITPTAASRLKLQINPEASIRMTGVGGETFAGVGTAKQVMLGSAPLRNIEFLVGGRDFGGEGSVGLLGQNFLHNFDVEYDLANGVIRLMIAKNCRKSDLAYWAPGKASIMPMEATDEVSNHIIARAQLNGQKIDILFDTGASTTILDRRAADRAGVPKDAGVEAGGVTSGIGRSLVETWVAPVTNLDLGDESIKRTHLRVGRLGLENADMLMGMDFFLSHGILVSNSQGKIYFTYNGGPVFNIGRPNAKPRPPTAVAAAGDDKLTGPDLDRRASASLARRDSAAAIADLTRAIALEPDNARYLSNRAHAYMLAGDPPKARQDLDAALKLKPDDVASLKVRGYILVHEGELKRAEADFDAAVRAAPEDTSLRVSFAAAYEAADHRDLAVREYDRWLAEHPKDDGAWSVLNSRCWVRATWNHELDKALADCDAAVKKGQHNSMVMDSRGMVQFRLGHYQQAVADYNIALNRQGRQAWSYLGRGLAKEKLGDKTGAEADIKQAIALDPGAPDDARKVGLDSALLPKGKIAAKVAKAD